MRPEPAVQLQLHLCLMDSLRQLDQREASGEHVAAALAAARGDDCEPPHSAAALLAVAEEFALAWRPAEALALLDEVGALLSPAQALHAGQVRVNALRGLGRVDAALAEGRQLLQRPGLRTRQRARLLDALALCEHLAGRLPAALSLVDEALALSAQAGDRQLQAQALSHRGSFLMEQGDDAAAEAALQAAAQQHGQLGLVGLQRASLYSLCCLYSAQGRPDQVLASAQQIQALQPPMQRSGLRVMVSLAFVDALIALGDLGLAWQHAHAAVDDALAVGEPLGLAAVVMTTVELFGLLGERAAVDRLLARLDPATLRQMPSAANEMWVAQAQFEWLAGRPAAACQALAQIDAPEQIGHLRVRWRWQVTAAALGLAALPDDAAPGMTDELRLHALAVRLAVLCPARTLPAMAGHTDDLRAVLQQAQAALAAPAVHTVAALALLRALPRAAWPAAGESLVGRLADSLGALAPQRAAFLALHH